MVARIAVITCAAVLLGHGDALAQNEALLNGRYAFRADGSSRNAPLQYYQGHMSRVGTLVFDGNGHVTNARIKETKDGLSRTIGGNTSSAGEFRFLSGTYEVNANNIGRIDLRFGFMPFPIIGYLGELHEVWDIAVANGGKELFLNIQSGQIIYNTGAGTVTADLHLTINGEAKVN